MQGVPQEIRFSDSVYNLDTVKRAAYRFTGKLAFDFTLEPGAIICQIVPLTNEGDVQTAIAINEFKNEVLDQDLRRSIAEETSSVRNVILAHVFSKTDLQASE